MTTPQGSDARSASSSTGGPAPSAHTSAVPVPTEMTPGRTALDTAALATGAPQSTGRAAAEPTGPAESGPAAPAPGGAPAASTPAGPPSPSSGSREPEQRQRPSADPAGETTVLPQGGMRRPQPLRTSEPRPTRAAERGASRPAGRARKARLALKRIDPWSVFVFSLVAAVFLGVALVVAVAALYAVLSGLGVVSSLNQLFTEVTGGEPGSPLLTGGRFVGGAAVLAAANVVLLTLLATLGALLYNICASFTGGVEVTLGERDG